MKEIKNREGFFQLMRRLKNSDEEKFDEISFEKNDEKALNISAFLMLFVPSVLIILVISIISILIFS